MILRETTVLEAIEGAFGSFSDAVQPAWGYILMGNEPTERGPTTEEAIKMLLEDEGECDGFGN